MKHTSLIGIAAITAALAFSIAPALAIPKSSSSGPSNSPPLKAMPQGKAMPAKGKARGGAGTAGPSNSPYVLRQGNVVPAMGKARGGVGTAGPSNSPPFAGR